MSLFQGRLTATIGSVEDNFGRCIDKEILIENFSGDPARNIPISFDQDYLAKQGAVDVYYGNEKDLLIPPNEKTVIARKDFIPIEYLVESKNDVLFIPKLSPCEYIHIFYGGETVIDEKRAEARQKFILSKKAGFMDSPRVASINYDGGFAKILRIPNPNCRTN